MKKELEMRLLRVLRKRTGNDISGYGCVMLFLKN